MKNFCFTVDDNIKFFKESTERNYESIFEHPYLAMYKRLHQKHNLKVQLNLFYECEGFNLSEVSEKYKKEFEESSDWLKLSFHSTKENPPRPYEFSDYDEVYRDCKKVNEEILRFSSEKNLAKTTTIHYCLATEGGVQALFDLKIIGLLGLYGNQHTPSISYTSTKEEGERIALGECIKKDGITYGAIDIVLNLYDEAEILRRIDALSDRDFIKVMIHEQYFYSDYPRYQSDFEDKISAAFERLISLGYKSIFFEERL